MCHLSRHFSRCPGPRVSSVGTVVWSSCAAHCRCDLRKPRPVLFFPRGAPLSPATLFQTLDLSENVTFIVLLYQLTQRVTSWLGSVGQWTYLPARLGWPWGKAAGNLL